jgi:Uma2 family endonuclease
MSVAQHISEGEYEQIVWADPDRKWELVEGRLREKPGMSWEHGELLILLGHLLLRQLDRRQFSVLGERRVRRSPGNIFISDLFVVPIAYGEEFRNRPGVLAIISQPLPLVVEVWSRSTGEYDVEAKIPVYQQRGDLEIWRIHPYERTLTAWRRQSDGSYAEAVYREGTVSLTALPGVAIDLAELFDI